MDKRYAIFDIGSTYTRIGFSEDIDPRIFTRTIYLETPEVQFFGDDALSQLYEPNVRSVHKVNIVSDWQAFEFLIDYAIRKLAIDTDTTNVVLLLNPGVGRDNIEKQITILLESFKFAGVALVSAPYAVLYALSMDGGLVVLSGSEMTYVVPIMENIVFPGGSRFVRVGGESITRFFMELLHRRGYWFSSIYIEDVRVLKELYCYVANNYEAELARARDSPHLFRVYTEIAGLPIEFDEERFIAPELVFQPELGGIMGSGLIDSIMDIIEKADLEAKKYFLENIVLVGGNTFLKGFKERLAGELRSRVKVELANRINIIAPRDRGGLPYKGGVKLVESESIKEILITNEEWQVEGPSVLDKKNRMLIV